MIDPLTATRSAFEFFLPVQRAFEAWRARRGTPGALIAVRLTAYKRFLYELGPAEGRAVLLRLGAALREAMPPSSEVGRTADEELCIWVPPGEDAPALARRAQDAIRAVVFGPGDATRSAGGATRPGGGAAAQRIELGIGLSEVRPGDRRWDSALVRARFGAERSKDPGEVEHVAYELPVLPPQTWTREERGRPDQTVEMPATHRYGPNVRALWVAGPESGEFPIHIPRAGAPELHGSWQLYGYADQRTCLLSFRLGSTRLSIHERTLHRDAGAASYKAEKTDLAGHGGCCDLLLGFLRNAPTPIEPLRLEPTTDDRVWCATFGQRDRAELYDTLASDGATLTLAVDLDRKQVALESRTSSDAST